MDNVLRLQPVFRSRVVRRMSVLFLSEIIFGSGLWFLFCVSPIANVEVHLPKPELVSAAATQTNATTAMTGPFSLSWSSLESDQTTSIAWGDYDGDGDLDLAVGSNGQPNRIYRNDGDALTRTLTLAWSAPITDRTTSVVWADVDGDGDLDLAVGNNGEPNRLYRNEGGTITPTFTLARSSAVTNSTTSIA